MSQPTRRKTSTSQPRARRDSARLFAEDKKKPSSKSSSPKKASVKTSSSKKASSAKKPASVKKATATTKKVSPKKPVTPKANLGSSPLLWTKEPPKNAQKSSGAMNLLRSIGSFIALFFGLIFKGVKRFFGALVSLIAKSKIATVLVILCAVILLAGLVDYGVNWGKVYPGIKVGEIDLSGKSVEESEKLIEDTYASRISGKTVYVFANEEASKDLEAALAQTNDENYSEQHSVEETQAHKLVWQVDAGTLGATIDTQGLVDEALSYGRENGGLINRLIALFSGHDIEPRAHYDASSLEALASDIDATIGNPRLNYDISVVEGHAVVVEGHDGEMVNRDTFTAELDHALLGAAGDTASFVAHVEHAPLQITWEMAQKVCERVNSSIIFGAQFIYNGIGWNANSIDVGNWVKTNITEDDGVWSLNPYLDYDSAKGTLGNHLKASFDGAEAKIRFSVNNEKILVHSESEGLLPQSRAAIEELSATMFDSETIPMSQPIITVESTAIPDTMSFDDALNAGLITTVSEYTTEYTANVTNRNHNIHLVSDLLDKSIISADGGEWSFNETAGNCNEEAGFKGAGSIINGEYVDEIGGGICQVATTVFNSVYDAGYPVVQRHNHSLYIASYPAGRDAAVSWPDLDLRWKNDTSSDVLLLTSYSDTTVTVALYGINPEYQVSTVTGSWMEGKKYETKKVTDDTLSPGYSYIKTYGSDGSSITVTRTVKDKSGKILHEDAFVSNYDAKNEVVVEGPKEEAKEEEQAQTDEEKLEENETTQAA